LIRRLEGERIRMVRRGEVMWCVVVSLCCEEW
jgi:hypothetical protein